MNILWHVKLYEIQLSLPINEVLWEYNHIWSFTYIFPHETDGAGEVHNFPTALLWLLWQTNFILPAHSDILSLSQCFWVSDQFLFSCSKYYLAPPPGTGDTVIRRHPSWNLHYSGRQPIISSKCYERKTPSSMKRHLRGTLFYECCLIPLLEWRDTSTQTWRSGRV
jgi:hypothetical protein